MIAINNLDLQRIKTSSVLYYFLMVVTLFAPGLVCISIFQPELIDKLDGLRLILISVGYSFLLLSISSYVLITGSDKTKKFEGDPSGLALLLVANLLINFAPTIAASYLVYRTTVMGGLPFFLTIFMTDVVITILNNLVRGMFRKTANSTAESDDGA